MGTNRNVYRVFMGKLEGKRPPGRPKCTWENNIQVGLWELWWGSMDLINLAQDRDQLRALMNTVMNLRIP
jgi:hypothetical protein